MFQTLQEVKHKVHFILDKDPRTWKSHLQAPDAVHLPAPQIQVILGLEPKCTGNQGLKDSINLRHSSFNASKAPTGTNTAFVELYKKTTTWCVLKEIFAPEHLMIRQKKGGLRLHLIC